MNPAPQIPVNIAWSVAPLPTKVIPSSQSNPVHQILQTLPSTRSKLNNVLGAMR